MFQIFSRRLQDLHDLEPFHFDVINPLRGGGAEAPLPSSVVEGSASILSGGHIFRQGAEVFSLFIFVAVFHTAVESLVLVSTERYRIRDPGR